MSFCILTFIISPGVPKIPPHPPAKAAIPNLIGNDIGSPLGETFCFATSYIAKRVVEYVICLKSDAERPLYKAKKPCDLTICKK